MESRAISGEYKNLIWKNYKQIVRYSTMQHMVHENKTEGRSHRVSETAQASAHAVKVSGK